MFGWPTGKEKVRETMETEHRVGSQDTGYLASNIPSLNFTFSLCNMMVKREGWSDSGSVTS